MGKLAFILIIAVLFFEASFGCSGNSSDNILVPDVDQEYVASSTEDITRHPSSDHLLCFYDIHIDPDLKTIEAVKNRTATFTLNAVPYLNGMTDPMYGISFGSLLFDESDPSKLKVDVEIRLHHPFPTQPQFSGYDLMAVVITNGDASLNYNTLKVSRDVTDTYLRNADGYTRWFNPTEFTSGGIFGYAPGGMQNHVGDATLNPYMYFSKGLGATDDLWSFLVGSNNFNGIFESGAGRMMHLEFPDPPAGDGLVFGFAAVCCWEDQGLDPPGGYTPYHRDEAIALSVDVTDDIYYDETSGTSGGDLILDFDIYSWVEKPTKVWIESTVLNFVHEVTDPGVSNGDNTYTYHFETQADPINSIDGHEFWIIAECSADYSNDFGVPNGTGNDPVAMFSRTGLVIATEPYNSDPVCNVDIVTTDFEGWGFVDVEFDASGSYDPDPGDILIFEWDFDNDGSFGEPIDDSYTGEPDHPIHRYEGEYTGSAALRLTDGNGGESVCYSAEFSTQNIFTPNTDQVQVSCYPTCTTSGNGMGSAGYAVREFLFRSNRMRIRQDGTAEGAQIYVDDLTDTTGIYITIWRLGTDNLFDRIGESENLVSGITTGVVNNLTFSSQISGVLEGDYYGIRVTQTGTANITQFVDRNSTTGGNSYWFNYNPGNTDVDFYYGSDGVGPVSRVVPIKLEMQAPSMVVIGDSIISGWPTTRSYIDWYYYHSEPSTTISTYLKDSLGVTAQNMGIGGSRIWQIAARFTPDCVNIKPRVAVIEGGVNDIAAGYTDVNWYTGYWLTILNACAQNDIEVIVIGILPWTNGSYSRMIIRDQWNTALENLVGTFPGFVYVDASTDVGQFRPSGPAGNLWDIQPAYDADGIHYTPAGHEAIANAIQNAIQN